VLAPDGRPAAGAEVRVLLEAPVAFERPTSPCPKSNWDRWDPDDSSSGPFVARTVTDGEGHFTASPLQGGWFSARALAPGMKGTLDHLRVEPGEVLAGVVIATETASPEDGKSKWPRQDRPELEPALALLRGRVAGSRGRPVAGALLDSGHGQAWTDAAGGFEIRVTADEEVCLDVSRPGFASIQTCVHPEGVPVEISLPEGVTLLGRVLNLNPEDPSPVLVYLRSESSSYDFFHPVQARADGTFRAGNLPPEQIDVEVWAGEQSLRAEIDLAPGDTEVRADFELPPVVPVSGRILDDLGGPVAQADVVAVAKYDQFLTNSRADGSFVLYLSPGSYEIYAAAPGKLALGKQDLKVADAPVEGLDFLLKSSRVLHGRLLGLIPGESVQLVLSRPGEANDHTDSELDQFQFENVEPGEWTIKAETWLQGSGTHRVVRQTFEILPEDTEPQLELSLADAEVEEIR
jgi:hypothetical protein